MVKKIEICQLWRHF